MEDIDSSFFSADSSKASSVETQLSNSFSFKQVGSLARYTEPVSGESTLDMVAEMFQNQPDLQAVPVEEFDHVIGVIDRKTCAAATNSAWKRLTARNVGEYVQRVNTVLYAQDFIEKVLQKVSAINREHGVIFFPVFNSRSFLGIVSLDDFLERIADIREQDLQKASVIQQNLLPHDEDFAQLPFKITAWNRMANALGGDFYQVEKLDEKKYLVGCYDVSGKNVAASLLTIAVGSFFRTLKLMDRSLKDPVQIISMLDRYLNNTVPVGNFITAAICYADLERGQLYLYNCGHTTVYIMFRDSLEDSNVKVASVKPGLPPLGMGAVAENLAADKGLDPSQKPYVALPIKADMHLSLYSDGFTDMQNDDGTRYDDDRAKDFFMKLYRKPASEIKDSVTTCVTDWIQNAMLPDDVTVLDIRF